MFNSLWPHEPYSPWNFPRPEYWSGLPFPSPGDLPKPGIEPRSLALILYQVSYKGSPRTLQWVVYPFSSRSSWPRNQTRISCITGGFFTNWAIREALISGMPFLEVETNMDSELPYGPMFPAIASRECHNIWPSSMDLTKHLLLQNSYFSKIQLSSLLSYFFIYLFLVGLGTHCCERAFSSCSKWGYSSPPGLGVSLWWLLFAQLWL